MQALLSICASVVVSGLVLAATPPDSAMPTPEVRLTKVESKTAPAQAPAEPAQPADEPAPRRERGKTIPGQELQDATEPLKPVRPRSVSEEARMDALAWFASGQILQKRNDKQG